MEPFTKVPALPEASYRRTRPSRIQIEVCYLAAIVVGILAKEIWDSLDSTGGVQVAWGRLIGALIVAPIVFAAISARFQRQHVALTDLALAFQHGFFWRTIFAQASPS